MASIIKVDTKTLAEAAKSRGYSPQKYIERLFRICHNSEVCAHRAYTKGGETVYILSTGVRTS